MAVALHRAAVLAALVLVVVPAVVPVVLKLPVAVVLHRRQVKVITVAALQAPFLVKAVAVAVVAQAVQVQTDLRQLVAHVGWVWLTRLLAQVLLVRLAALAVTVSVRHPVRLAVQTLATVVAVVLVAVVLVALVARVL